MSRLEAEAYWAACDKLADEVSELLWLITDMKQAMTRANWAYARYDICGGSVDQLERDIKIVAAKLAEKQAEWSRLLNSDSATEAQIISIRPRSMNR